MIKNTHTQNWNVMYAWLFRKSIFLKVSIEIHTMSITERTSTIKFIMRLRSLANLWGAPCGAAGDVNTDESDMAVMKII